MTCEKCKLTCELVPEFSGTCEVIELCPRHAAVDELIEALKDAHKLPLPWVGGNKITYADWESVFAKIEAALKKAGER